MADSSLMNDTAEVLCVRDVASQQIGPLLARFGLRVVTVVDAAEIPGSYWGEREAGLIGNQLYFRGDTPLQSLLHEACHFICMDEVRRASLHRDAGGDYDEENAVCYLQILLADYVAGLGRQRMLNDMDAWGYTFRLGSAQAWFEQEATSARGWLQAAGLIDGDEAPTWMVRR
ncbi:MAG: hypothetical protein QM808_01565 [Steroidobacteraceae bacterium]